MRKQIYYSGQNFTVVNQKNTVYQTYDSGDCVDLVFSRSVDIARDKDKIREAIKKYQRKYENVSSEENLEELVKPYFREKRDIYHLNMNATLKPDVTHGHLFDQFNIFGNLPDDLVSTKNHPEEIMRWMEEVLPKHSKELEINGTICHVRALEMLNEDLKRNRSKPFARYYKEAHIEQFCELENERFLKRLQSTTTTETPDSTKSFKQIRDEVKENIKKEGKFITEGPLSETGSDQDMPSYLVREFKAKYPHLDNDHNGTSVHESDFLFGHFRERRSLSEELREKLSIENEKFKSRFKTALHQKENETSDGTLKDTIKEHLHKNPMYKRFQDITINYDDLPIKHDWKTDNTTLFSLENSLGEFINSNEFGDFNCLIGLKKPKMNSYLNSFNASLRKSRVSSPSLNKNYSDTNIKKESNTHTVREKRPMKVTRPTFKRILRTQIFNPRKKSLSEEESEYRPIHSNETFHPKDLTRTLEYLSVASKEGQNRKLENINSIDEMEFKDGLFGLNSYHKNEIGDLGLAKKYTRTTDILIKRFARINTTWHSRLRTKVFRIKGDSDMRQYEFDSSNSLTVEKKQMDIGRYISELGYNGNLSENYTDIKKEELIRRKRSVFSKRKRNSKILRHIRDTDTVNDLQSKTKIKTPDFVKDWDAQDERHYDTKYGGHKLLVDDGTGDIRKLLKEQHKDSSDDDLNQEDKELFKKFKEIDDYGVRSMPSQLKPGGGKSDETFNVSLLNELRLSDNKSECSQITLDSKSFEDNFDDASRRYNMRLARLEKLTGLRFKSPGPGYFTVTTEVDSSSTISPRGTRRERTSLLSTKQVIKKQWITADSEDIIEGNKEDLEHFLNFEPDENQVPWTEFNVKGMEKFIDKTLSDRNSTRVYRLYRP